MKTEEPTYMEFDMSFPPPPEGVSSDELIQHAKACGAATVKVLKTDKEWTLSVRFEEKDVELYVKYVKQFPGHEKSLLSEVARHEANRAVHPELYKR